MSEGIHSFAGLPCLFVAFVVLAGLAAPAIASEHRFPVRVTQVVSGDTVIITGRTGRKTSRVRLAGIYPPELARSRQYKDQPFAVETRDKLRRMLHNQDVTLDARKIIRGIEGGILNSPDLFVGTLYVGDTNINLALVKQGYAWVWPKDKDYANLDNLRAAQAQARAEHRGLWSKDNPVPPWQWRAENMGRKGWDDYVLGAATAVHEFTTTLLFTARDKAVLVYDKAREAWQEASEQ